MNNSAEILRFAFSNQGKTKEIWEKGRGFGMMDEQILNHINMSVTLIASGVRPLVLVAPAAESTRARRALFKRRKEAKAKREGFVSRMMAKIFPGAKTAERAIKAIMQTWQDPERWDSTPAWCALVGRESAPSLVKAEQEPSQGSEGAKIGVGQENATETRRDALRAPRPAR
jgi:hypothetical protein